MQSLPPTTSPSIFALIRSRYRPLLDSPRSLASSLRYRTRTTDITSGQVSIWVKTVTIEVPTPHARHRMVYAVHAYFTKTRGQSSLVRLTPLRQLPNYG